MKKHYLTGEEKLWTALSAISWGTIIVICFMPWLWLRLVMLAMLVASMFIIVWCKVDDMLIDVDTDKCINKQLNQNCPVGVHIVGDYIKEQTQARTPVSMSDLDFPNSK